MQKYRTRLFRRQDDGQAQTIRASGKSPRSSPRRPKNPTPKVPRSSALTRSRAIGLPLAIEKRLSAKASLTNIRQLDYNFHSGLHYIVFEVSPLAESPGKSNRAPGPPHRRLQSCRRRRPVRSGAAEQVRAAAVLRKATNHSFSTGRPAQSRSSSATRRSTRFRSAAASSWSNGCAWAVAASSSTSTRTRGARSRRGRLTAPFWTPILDDCGPDPFIIA